MWTRKGRQRQRGSAAVCMAALLIGALLGGLLPTTGAAAEFTVTAVDGIYLANDGVPSQVYSIGSSSAEWAVASATANGNTYRNGTEYFAPENAAVSVTFTRTGFWLPTSAPSISGAAITNTPSVSFNETGTMFTCAMTMGTEVVALSVDSSFAQAAAVPTGNPLTAVGTDGKTYIDDGNGVYSAASNTVTVVFPASAVYRIHSQIPGNYSVGDTSYQIEQGADFPFELMNGSEYLFPESVSAELVTGWTLNGTEADVSSLNLIAAGGSIAGGIPAAFLSDSPVNTVTFGLNTTTMTKLIGVTPRSGPGYTLAVLNAAQPGGSAMDDGGVLTIGLTLSAAYSHSVPSLSAPAGFTVEAMSNSGKESDFPGYDWIFFITTSGDTTFPESGDLAVTVSGVVPNATAGGGDGGAATPAIRVDNQLDTPDVSSDTTLWPAGTTEQGGVSTTVLTDVEVDALVKLAAQHASDTDPLTGDGLKEGIICIENKTTKGCDTYILNITQPQYEKLEAANWDRLTMSTPAGSFSLYPGTIQQTAEQNGSGGVQLELKRLDNGGRPGVDATLTANSKQVTVLEETYGVRLFIPYTPQNGEDLNALVVEYLHEDGTKELVTECSYDKTLGGIVFFTGHLSKFGITYRPAAFSDVTASHWANPYVTFLVSRGILNGRLGGTFRPDEPATRGEFIAVVTRALSVAHLPKKAILLYSDVPASSFVSSASNWLYYNNLVGDITSDGKLRPGDAITREDMALLVNNVAQGVGLRVRSRGLDAGYTDAAGIAAYAQSPVKRLRAAGILEMPQNYKFHPKAALNRGEMAQIVATLLSNL